MTRNSITKPTTVSCGCVSRSNTVRRNTKHGNATRAGRHPLYTIWKDIRKRCYNRKSTRYAYYGGRGIVLCQRWRDSFTAFLADVGPRPEGLSLDRINVGGNYSCGHCPECREHDWPMNVRWATATQQANNKRNNTRMICRGVEKTLSEWAREVGLSPGLLRARLDYGWSPERAVETPARPKRERPENYRIRAIRVSMIRRCTNPSCRSFARYGGRGITVCSRWLTVRGAFAADMGPRPSPRHSVDRVDNDKGYWCGKSECPDCGPLGRLPNCRWATRIEQWDNRRRKLPGGDQPV